MELIRRKSKISYDVKTAIRKESIIKKYNVNQLKYPAILANELISKYTMVFKQSSHTTTQAYISLLKFLLEISII